MISVLCSFSQGQTFRELKGEVGVQPIEDTGGRAPPVPRRAGRLAELRGRRRSPLPTDGVPWSREETPRVLCQSKAHVAQSSSACSYGAHSPIVIHVFLSCLPPPLQWVRRSQALKEFVLEPGHKLQEEVCDDRNMKLDQCRQRQVAIGLEQGLGESGIDCPFSIWPSIAGFSLVRPLKRPP